MIFLIKNYLLYIGFLSFSIKLSISYQKLIYGCFRNLVEILQYSEFYLRINFFG